VICYVYSVWQVIEFFFAAEPLLVHVVGERTGRVWGNGEGWRVGT
jgi:hypothetical protein